MPRTNIVHDKFCDYCGKKYTPNKLQYLRQKYCTLRCKWAARDLRLKGKGQGKGGYNRETYIRLWVKAMGVTDTRAYCHYCDITLYPDKFVVEHKIPRVKLKSKQEIQDINNLVVSCYKCNSEKSATDYNLFMKKVNG
jgi:5-methylcytosine-specific restriction endonuclease McrA